MNTKIAIEFNGNLTSLVEFMESTFKDPDAMNLNVNICQAPCGVPQVVQNSALGKYSNSAIGKTHALIDNCRSAIARLCLANLVDLSSVKYTHLTRALPEIVDFFPDKRINAIKKVRGVTGATLDESKRIVETIGYEYLRLFAKKD